MKDLNDIDIVGGRGLTVDAGRKGDWMQTWMGKRFYLEDPQAKDVDILDIIFALSNMTRYGGHCRFYSVAEHSILVSELVPSEFALAGLLHDASEAYIADVIRPLKRSLGSGNKYFQLEDRVMAVILEKYGLHARLPKEVKEADLAVCGLEKEKLHPRSDPWDLPFPVPRHLQLACLAPSSARIAFLKRFCALTGANFENLFGRMMDMIDQDYKAMHR